MGFNRRYRRGRHGSGFSESTAQQFRPASLSAWSAGFARLIKEGCSPETGDMVVLWVRGDEVLGTRFIKKNNEAFPQLMSMFMQLQVKLGLPGRVRVANPELARQLQHVMPSRVSVVRTPTPEIYRALEKGSGIAEGTIFGDHVAPANPYLELSPLERVASELLGLKAWELIPSETIFSLASEALGIRDAGIQLVHPAGQSPQLFVFPERQPAVDLAKRATETSDSVSTDELSRLVMTYVHVPDASETERKRLEHAGWTPPFDRPNLQPMGRAIDVVSADRDLTAEEYRLLRICAFVSLAIFDEPFPKLVDAQNFAPFSFNLKLDDGRIIDVLLRWPVDPVKGVAFRRGRPES